MAFGAPYALFCLIGHGQADVTLGTKCGTHGRRFFGRAIEATRQPALVSESTSITFAAFGGTHLAAKLARQAREAC